MFVKLNISSSIDRIKFIESLHDNGYNAWIETANEYIPTRKYICIEVNDNDVYQNYDKVWHREI